MDFYGVYNFKSNVKVEKGTGNDTVTFEAILVLDNNKRLLYNTIMTLSKQLLQHTQEADLELILAKIQLQVAKGVTNKTLARSRARKNKI